MKKIIIAFLAIAILTTSCKNMNKTQKGAAIGAVVGATAGAGSVYVQGPNDLALYPGTEVTVRATGPRG